MSGEVIFNIREIAARHPYAHAEMSYNKSIATLREEGAGRYIDQIQLVLLTKCKVTLRTEGNLIIPGQPVLNMAAGGIIFKGTTGRLHIEEN